MHKQLGSRVTDCFFSYDFVLVSWVFFTPNAGGRFKKQNNGFAFCIIVSEFKWVFFSRMQLVFGNATRGSRSDS